MEIRNGQPYSYCGLSVTEVCCFIDFDRTIERTGKDSPNGIERKLKISTNSTTTRRPTHKSSSSSRKTLSSVQQFNEFDTESGGRESVQCGVQKIAGNLDSIARFKEWPWHVRVPFHKH